MRIAYFTNQYPAPSHTFIRREILALEDRGNTITRYAVRRSQAPLQDPQDQTEQTKTSHIVGGGVLPILRSAFGTLISKPFRSLKALRECLRFARLSDRGHVRHLAYLVEAMVLAAWCKRDGIDHLHVHFGTNAATVAAVAHVISGVPFSFTVHGPEEFDKPEGLGLSRKAQLASFVATVSSFGRSQMMRWAHADDWDKINVVHCGIDASYQANLDVALDENPRLVCVARLSEQKGHLLLLEAAGRLKTEGASFKLILIGDGPLRPDVERMIDRLSLKDTVILKGWQSQEQIRLEVCQSRAMVLPSFAEGLPVVIMEAMALKRPVVSTFIAGIPELVKPETGWLVPAGDVSALVDAMRTALATSPAEILAMGEAGRTRVMKRHDIAHSALQLEDLIRASILRETASGSTIQRKNPAMLASKQ